ncbi:hypothetical protein [Aliiroseovarius subalbicans]|uniref:hypothetical protein n=1 Tax=Aliiroseovarius subalbicans TaxID=2925840 RepID=UPI001F596BBC|nr:hypothetical protein [Aliiroseovarius subalbicans]MCI2398392.1 hypothetical protein [Aliiroseovarius subalbicans]
MDLLEQVADALARDVLEAERETGDISLMEEVKKSIGASSTTLEEAFLTAVRIRRAEARGRALLSDLVRAHKTTKADG